MNRPPTPNVEENNGNAKVNAEQVRSEMNQTWRNKSREGNSSNGEVMITESNRLDDSPISN